MYWIVIYLFCTHLTFDLILRLRNISRLGIHPYGCWHTSRNTISMDATFYSILPSKVKISLFCPNGLPTINSSDCPLLTLPPSNSSGYKRTKIIGERLFCILWSKVSLCFSLLDVSVSQPVSNRREFIVNNSVAPVSIRAASFCIFSSPFDSCYAQLFHTTSAYSTSGRIKKVNRLKRFPIQF